MKIIAVGIFDVILGIVFKIYQCYLFVN